MRGLLRKQASAGGGDGGSRQPRLATVLANRRWERRHQPYSHTHTHRNTSNNNNDRQKQEKQQAASSSSSNSQAAQSTNSQPESSWAWSASAGVRRKLSPRFPYLPRDVQEVHLRRVLRHITPGARPQPAELHVRGRDAVERETQLGHPSDPSLISSSLSCEPSSPPVVPTTSSAHGNFDAEEDHEEGEAKLLVDIPPPAEEEARPANVEDLSAAVPTLQVDAYQDQETSADGGRTTQDVIETSLELSPPPAAASPPLPAAADIDVQTNVGNVSDNLEREDREEGKLAVEDEGTDVKCDEPVHDAHVAPDHILTTEAAPIPSGAPIRDEGYEGSGTSEAEVDELEEQEEGELQDKENAGVEHSTYQIPAYRRPVVSNADKDIPSSPSPTSLQPPQAPPRAPLAKKDPWAVLFLDPKKRKHDLVDAPTGGPLTKERRLNWAFTERARRSPAPPPRAGWDKRTSKFVSSSRAFYSDSTAKPLLPPVEPRSLYTPLFRTLIKETVAWLKAGNVLFNGARPATPVTTVEYQRKTYDRCLKAARKAEDGIELGVKTANLATLHELKVVSWLKWAKGQFVDERWGTEAVELKSRIEKYGRIVEERCYVEKDGKRKGCGGHGV